MKKFLITTTILLVIFITFLKIYTYKISHVQKLHIALAGPLTGSGELIGKSLLRGVNLYFDDINGKCINKRKQIAIDIYDDKNETELAKKVASEIVKRNRAVAVIGHWYSSCSYAAGMIYKKNLIPAITPGSTNVKVTAFNEWYFRAVFNDNLQGSFLATYARQVLNHESASIIHDDSDYGSYLATVFEASAHKLGLEINYNKEISSDKTLENCEALSITEKIKQLNEKSKNRPGIIFLAMRVMQGVKIVKAIKEAKLPNTIITPDAFASNTFANSFNKYNIEQEKPGYYTNEIYTSTHIIFDTSNEKAQQFKKDYLNQYGELPDWIAAFAYDTSMILHKAIVKSNPSYSKIDIKSERIKIKNSLKSFNSHDNAVSGITGLTYFNNKGDSLKPISIGIYKNNNIISALTQLQEFNNNLNVLSKNNSSKSCTNSINKTQIVYTGTKINEISEINREKNQCLIDFFLWFRFKGDIDISNIVFLNSVDIIDMKNPVEKKIKHDLTYLSYRIKAYFKLNYLPNQNAFMRDIAGFSFYHKNFTRDKLIFVIDVLGMGLINGKTFDSVLANDTNIVDKAWSIDKALIYQTIKKKETFGDPDHLNDTNIDFSVINIAARLKKNEFSVRGSIPANYANSMMIISFGLIFFILIIIKRFKSKYLSLISWICLVFLICLSFLALEEIIASGLIKENNIYHLRYLQIAFDIIWWFIPATIVNSLIKKLVWQPLARKTKRKIPNIVERFVVLLVYLLAIVGIIAFVFDQKITSLLATSGVIAMIIGLAIQINISNIFSGIAINMERPFHIGDWIKCGDVAEGKVIDITWRTTRLKTRDDCVISIPNSIASESVIHNFHYPDDKYRIWFHVHIDANHSPDRVRKILLDAVLSARTVLKKPSPVVRFVGLTEWAADYLVAFSAKDYSDKIINMEDVWSRVWTHLYRAGIMPAIQRQEVHMFKGIKERGKDANQPLSILKEVEIFANISDTARTMLGKLMKLYSYNKGSTIVTQGQAGDSLFIIVEGVVEVRVKVSEDKEIEVDRMGAGTFFGEMALLTGEPRTASIVATTDTLLYEITKKDIEPLIIQQPELSKELSKALTERTLNRETKKGEHIARQNDKSYKDDMYNQILLKIKNFFAIK